MCSTQGHGAVHALEQLVSALERETLAHRDLVATRFSGLWIPVKPSSVQNEAAAGYRLEQRFKLSVARASRCTCTGTGSIKYASLARDLLQ